MADRLGYADPSTAVRSHCKGVQKLHPISDALRRTQEARVLSEPAALELAFEGVEVRAVKRGIEPWWVLADVCRVLDVGNPSDAAKRLDEDEKGVISNDTPGGRQETTVINESGLYSLILTSRKPSARRFKKWVTGTVLPAIRRTGGYMVAAPEETAEELALRDPCGERLR